MGGRGAGVVERGARDLRGQWSVNHHFEMYDDVAPVLRDAAAARLHRRRDLEFASQPRCVPRALLARRHHSRVSVSWRRARLHEAAPQHLRGGARAGQGRGGEVDDGGRQPQARHRRRAERRAGGRCCCADPAKCPPMCRPSVPVIHALTSCGAPLTGVLSRAHLTPTALILSRCHRFAISHTDRRVPPGAWTSSARSGATPTRTTWCTRAGVHLHRASRRDPARRVRRAGPDGRLRLRGRRHEGRASRCCGRT